MTDPKHYEVEGIRFEFAPNGGPYKGLLTATSPELAPYTAEVNLPRQRSRNEYAGEAAEVCGMSKGGLKRALNALC